MGLICNQTVIVKDDKKRWAFPTIWNRLLHALPENTNCIRSGNRTCCKCTANAI